MVNKADPKQDYYGDLELSPNAEPEDIKKQFRKLGASVVRRSNMNANLES